MNDQNTAAQLMAANHQLTIQHQEIALRATELSLAIKALKFQINEKEKRANELAAANLALAFQNTEKENRAFELIGINNELRKAESYQKEYNKGLEEIIHMVSHQVRHPICQILGISKLFSKKNSRDEINTMISFIKKSASSLDLLTTDLSKLISTLKNKGACLPNLTRLHQ